MYRDLFPIVVELFGLYHEVALKLAQPLAQNLEIMLHLGIAPLHRQLKVEHGLFTQAVAEPGGDEVRHPRRFLNHVTNQPVGILLRRTIAETIVANMFDLTTIHQGFSHGAIVHGTDHHASTHQLIGPASRARPQIDSIQPRGQTHIPLIIRNEDMERLFQLQRRAARRVSRELQPRDTHVEW